MMCGIAGALAPSFLTEHETEKFRDLMFLNTLRGFDSSGMYDFIPKLIDSDDHEVWVWKSTRPASQFIPYVVHKQNTKDGRWSKNRPRAVIGHARAATVGAVSDNNAHPFAHGSIVGVHNGTITGKFKYSSDFETDSEALIKLISEEGIEEALKRVHKESTNAAYALLIFDNSTKKLHAIRNSQRPLHVYAGAGATYFSSTEKDLSYVFPSSTVTYSTTAARIPTGDDIKLPPSVIKELPPHHLLTFNLGQGGSQISVKECSFFPPRTTTHYPYSGASGGRPPFSPNTYQHGQTEVSPLASHLLPYHRTMTEAQLETTGSQSPDQHNCFYALAFDRYFSAPIMRAYYWWAYRHPIRFCQLVNEVWEENKQPAQRRALISFSGSSKQALKNVLSGRPAKYFADSPFVRCYHDVRENVDRVSQTAKGSDLFTSYKKEHAEEKKAKAIAEAKPTTEAEATPRVVPYGNSGSGGRWYANPSWIKNTLDAGCVECKETLEYNHVFWKRANEPICEACQDAHLATAGSPGATMDTTLALELDTHKHYRDGYQTSLCSGKTEVTTH